MTGLSGWLSQLRVQLLISLRWLSQGHGIEPHIKLYAEHGTCLRFSLSPSPSAFPPTHVISLSSSLSQKKIEVTKIPDYSENLPLNPNSPFTKERYSHRQSTDSCKLIVTVLVPIFSSSHFLTNLFMVVAFGSPTGASGATTWFFNLKTLNTWILKDITV